jgi:hypothetical protein
MTELREIERFKAQSDDGAYETTIIVRQEFISAATRGNPGGVARGRKEARTIDGQTCNYTGGARVEIVGTGEVLKRV